MSTKVCISCGKECIKAEYAKRQWKREQATCRLCTEAGEKCTPSNTNTTAEQQQQTKMCIQCNKNCDQDQFPQKQWTREDPLCRLCYEHTKISKEKTRQCHECKLVLPRTHYNIYQWGKGNDALCHACRELLNKRVIESIDNGPAGIKDLQDGTTVCLAHSLECCDICMMDFTLPNRFTRMRKSLGRDLTEDEYEEQTRAAQKEANIHINRKICIMDGQSVCPRSGRKLRCPCNEVTYCSTDCQRHHWTIHKMTCKARAKNKKAKADKKSPPSVPSHRLTDEQLNFIRMEAFMAENSAGGEHSIEECAYQLGEHPLLIGGGSIKMSVDGQTFVKGDVAKIYMESKGVVWDGSPRFGLPPYVQQKTPFDWIAKARQGRP